MLLVLLPLVRAAELHVGPEEEVYESVAYEYVWMPKADA